MTKDLNRSNEAHILKHSDRYFKVAGQRKYKVDGMIRNFITNHIFVKWYTPNYSTGVFKILEMQFINLTIFWKIQMLDELEERFIEKKLKENFIAIFN